MSAGVYDDTEWPPTRAFEDAPARRAAGMRTVGITEPEQADALHADVLIPDIGAVRTLSGLEGVEL